MTSPGGASPLIVSASPRAGGNSDFAADRLAAALAAHGQSPALVRLRDHTILPCTGCGGCDVSGRCVHVADDDAEALFVRLRDASRVFFCSPIYFYHLPSQFKAWIDRSQSWYVRWQAGDAGLRALAERDAHPVLVAGRPKGEKLFDGALLTLRFFCVTFALRTERSLLLRGYDAPGDLASAAKASEQLDVLARSGEAP